MSKTFKRYIAMSHQRMSESATITAPAEKIYKLLTDYRYGHPRILPPSFFRNLVVVEDDTIKNGAVIQYEAGPKLAKRLIRAAITEVEPNRILQERDITPGATLVTTFTLTPTLDQTATILTIATEWDTKAGLPGLFERWLYPLLLKNVYKEELALIQKEVS
jgi:uncharacterized protein YndB with AHSA1/START domain